MAIRESDSSTILSYPFWLTILIPRRIPESSASRTLQSSKGFAKTHNEVPAIITDDTPTGCLTSIPPHNTVSVHLKPTTGRRIPNKQVRVFPN
ncbi:putative disease resistance protein [Sesbania bispinosa]|nr:putative disease resistance protein [Sesbania bispinosa]